MSYSGRETLPEDRLVKTLRLFLFVLMQALLMLSLSGCDHRPKVLIEGGRAPQFKLMGQGKIQVITVSGPDLGTTKPKRSCRATTVDEAILENCSEWRI